MFESVIHWLENHQQPCPYKKNLNIDCPGCGMQRAIIELLRGHIWESILLYPALIPMIIMFLVLVVHLIFDFKHGAKVLKYLFILNVTIVIIHYAIKIYLFGIHGQ